MSQSQLTAIPQGGTTPAIDAFAIVPADGVDLPSLARALYIGSAGDMHIANQRRVLRDPKVAVFGKCRRNAVKRVDRHASVSISS